MLRPELVPWITAVLLCRAAAQYSSDQCSWRGSGLSQELRRRDVQQIYLRCSRGSVRWLYPTGAMIVSLRTNTESARTDTLSMCIRPHGDSQGSHLYLQRPGHLEPLLLADAHQPQAVLCFSLSGGGALFMEAVPQTDVSRTVTAFQYELVSDRRPGGHMYLMPGSAGTDSCEPCSEEDVLMSVCTSDFAASGNFGRVASRSDQHSEVVVTLNRLFRQKGGTFTWGGASVRRWSGRVNVPSRCAVHPREDEYLLTGSVYFGDAWLDCSARYDDFLKLYARALRAETNPCRINVD